MLYLVNLIQLIFKLTKLFIHYILNNNANTDNNKPGSTNHGYIYPVNTYPGNTYPGNTYSGYIYSGNINKKST